MIDDIKKVNPSGNPKKNSLHLYELFPMMSSFFTFDTTCIMIIKRVPIKTSELKLKMI